MRYVVLPQAFRRMVPALVNEGVTLIKDSSLVSAIGLAELALAARTVAGAYSRYWEPYLAISAVYLVLTLAAVAAGQAARGAGASARALNRPGARDDAEAAARETHMERHQAASRQRRLMAEGV